VKLPGRLRRKLRIEICEKVIVELRQDYLILKKVSPNTSIEDILKTAKKVNTKKQADEKRKQQPACSKAILDF
jgi:bifunctional DNA-binding transcriptional regulator/antitoxin component of YhaV-PrlF toxin-antitoxin module